MSKFWHILGSVGFAAIPVLTSVGQHFVSQHPGVATGLAATWAIIGNLLQSPVAQK